MSETQPKAETDPIPPELWLKIYREAENIINNLLSIKEPEAGYHKEKENFFVGISNSNSLEK